MTEHDGSGEIVEARRQCQAVTARDVRCREEPAADSDYCIQHATEAQRRVTGFAATYAAVAARRRST